MQGPIPPGAASLDNLWFLLMVAIIMILLGIASRSGSSGKDKDKHS